MTLIIEYYTDKVAMFCIQLLHVFPGIQNCFLFLFLHAAAVKIIILQILHAIRFYKYIVHVHFVLHSSSQPFKALHRSYLGFLFRNRGLILMSLFSQFATFSPVLMSLFWTFSSGFWRFSFLDATWNDRKPANIIVRVRVINVQQTK